MSYDSIIDSIQYKKYSNAAAEMLYEALWEKIHRLTQKQRASKTNSIARKLKSMHLKLRYLREFGKTPREIAEETYEKTREEIRLDKFDDVIEW